MKQHNTVVGVFEDRTNAQQAVRELKQNGFRDDQIGVVGHKSDSTGHGDDDDGSYVGEGAAAGLAAGAGIGALWGLGIMAGVLPVIGPAIAGGTLAVVLSSAAAGAAAAGVAGALVGLGLSKEDADYYEGEFKAGRTIVTVNASGRESEALDIIRRFHGYSSSDRTATAAATRPHAEQLSKTNRGAASGTPARSSEGSGVLQAKEERLHVEKDKVTTGNVNVRKETHVEHKTIDVPVEREEVVIERRAVSGQPAGDASFGEGQQEIRIPVREEQIHVEKTPVVTEEVAIGKRTVRDTKHVTDTVRKEEIKVEQQGDIDVRDQRGSNS